MGTFVGQQADPEAASEIPMPPFPGEIHFDKIQKRPNDTVKIWQNSLWARGYTSLKVDGFFGEATLRCVVDWTTIRPQARNVDGKPKLNLWRDLTTNPHKREWGPCSSWCCPAKGRLPTSSADEALEPSPEAWAAYLEDA